ncbi:MAG: ABC transporter ATP-binding protein [Pigmentiphaga sp.]
MTVTASASQTPASAMTPAALTVSGLTKTVQDSLGSLTILHEIDFTVPQGQTVAITGSSGSGKSTLLGLMAGLDVPTSGQVKLLGHDLFARSEDERARLRAAHVGFVFQSFQLLPNLTALENVMLPLELLGRPARAAALEMLARVGLENRASHYPKTLSGGEQQRVSLARAFVMKPALLFADEPTGSLDANTGRAVIDLMFDLNEALHTTLILVTHDAQLAARCERQLMIESGRLKSDSARPL